MNNRDLTEKSTEQNAPVREETRSAEKYIRPAVNIIETEEGLVLQAEIPGASRDKLDVNVEKGILTINAPVAHATTGNPVYREFELASYYRQFSIPESLDREKAAAEYSNGILTLRIPKAEVAKPRRITVQAG